MQALKNYSYWQSTLAIMVVFILLNNLMGCEHTCLERPNSLTIDNTELAATTATFEVLVTAGDDGSRTTSGEVGCQESCEVEVCTLSGFRYQVFDSNGDQVMVDPSIYVEFGELAHVVTEPNDRSSSGRTLTFTNLTPASTYRLVVKFPRSYSCSSTGPMQSEVAFTTLGENCETLDCGDHGSFNQSTCQCDCDQGYSGINCEVTEAAAPANLIYDPDSVVVDVNEEAVSPVPTLDGTPPFTFALGFVNPTNNNVTASIDENTGVIRLTSITENNVQGYQVSVRVSNNLGEATFDKAFIVNVTSQAAGAPTDLIYDPDTVTYDGMGAFESVEPQVTGNVPFTFSIAGVSPQSAAGAFNIDANTGVITAVDLLEFGEDTYRVDVTVTNNEGSTTFEGVYTLVVQLGS